MPRGTRASSAGTRARAGCAATCSPSRARAWVECGGRRPRRSRVDTATLLDGPTPTRPGRRSTGCTTRWSRSPRAALREADAGAARAPGRLRKRAAPVIARVARRRWPQVLDPRPRRTAGCACAPPAAGAREDALLRRRAAWWARRSGIAVPPAAAGRRRRPRRSAWTRSRAPSRVRTRRVVLREGWWRGDTGPLLALAGRRGHAPSRSSPSPPGATTLHDPAAAHAAAADARRGRRRWQPFALHLLPPVRRRRPLDARTLLRFGAAGLRARPGHAAARRPSRRWRCSALLTAVATGIIFNTVIPGAERAQLLQLAVILARSARWPRALFELVRGVALLRLETRMGAAVQAAAVGPAARAADAVLPRLHGGRPGGARDGHRRDPPACSRARRSPRCSAALFSLFNFALLFYYKRRWRALARRC